MIDGYKKISNNKYKVILSDETLILYDDIIVKYNLLSKKDLNKKEIDEIKQANDEYFYYDQSLKFVSRQLRSEAEIGKFLQKYDINRKTISNVINKLKENNVINDNVFTEAYIHDAILLGNNGPNKVINNLEKLKVNKSIIANKIKSYTREIELDKIDKYVSKQVKINKNKSSNLLKQQISNNLNMLGYTSECISSILENFSLDDTKIYEKEYQKEYNKLSKKYSGSELEYRMKNKMYQKGFRQ